MLRDGEQPIDITQQPHPRGPSKIVAPDIQASQANDFSGAHGAAPHLFGLSIIVLGLMFTLLWSGWLAWCACALLAQLLAA